jgi:hypothetical protein
MKAVNYDKVNDATSRLERIKADSLFPGLLSDRQLDEIQQRRVKKEAIKRKKTGVKTKVKDVTPNEYIVKGGGVDDNGIIVDDFNIVQYMNDAEDPATGTLRDFNVDTRDLHHAKNFYDFTMNILAPDAPKYSIPWARQMWIGIMLFAEACPCCSDKRVFDVHNIPKNLEPDRMLKRMVLLEYGICPKCGRHKWELIKKHGLRNYRQLVNVLGQRSGKSSSAAQYYAYLTHQYLMFPNIAELAPSMFQASTQLTCTMVSLNFAKALGVMWVPYKKLIENSSWFGQYFQILDRGKERTGHEMYRNSSQYITFYHKNIKFYPSGPNSTTLRGDTRIGAGLDELGLFPLPKGNDEEDEQSERANADEAHKSLMNSLLTAQTINTKLLKDGYSSAPSPLLLCVSSPISQRDKVMRLLKESKTEIGSQFILGVNLPTWEMNPGMDRDFPEIVMAYASNPEKAERDFGANPPSVHSRFIYPKTIEEGVFINGQNSHTLTHQFDKPGEIYGKLDKFRNFRYPALVTIDAGAVDNSFTLIGGHYDFDNAKTVITTVLECVPQEDRRVNFNMMYLHIILPILRDLNAVALLADQWQSLDLLNRAQDDMGLNPLGKPRCRARQYSPRRKDFNTTVAMLQNKNLILPSVTKQEQEFVLSGQVDNYKVDMLNKPVPHLMLQMVTVKDVGELRCPEKGDGFTDDIFRACVLFASKIHDARIMERLVEAKHWTYGEANQAIMPAPVYVSRGGRGAFQGLR